VNHETRNGGMGQKRDRKVWKGGKERKTRPGVVRLQPDLEDSAKLQGMTNGATNVVRYLKQLVEKKKKRLWGVQNLEPEGRLKGPG